MAQPEVVWADTDGEFQLRDGSWGNPGCDGCGETDAVAKMVGSGEYLCGPCLDDQQANMLGEMLAHLQPNRTGVEHE